MMQSKRPEIRVFAGPNGSGKSTLTKCISPIGIYSNADDIVSQTQISNLEAAKLVYNQRINFINNQQDFTFETVLSSDRNLKLLQMAKEKGYFIKCYYVLTYSPNINIIRVKSRVNNGGHDVPKDKIISRYYKALKLIPELIKICDIVHIYDNSFAKPVRIYRKHKEQFTIFHNENWFEDKIKNLINPHNNINISTIDF